MSQEPRSRVADPILPRLDPDEAGYLGDELKSLRELVSRGDTLAIAGGSVMAWWGLVLATASVIEVLMAAGSLPASLPVNWGIVLMGLLGSLVIWRGSRKRYFFNSWRTQAISTIWLFAGISIFVFMLGSRWTHVSEPHIQMAFLAIVFGLVLAVVATSSRHTWLLAAAGCWLLTACIMFVLDSHIARFAVMSVAYAGFLMAPGLFLLRTERRAQPKEERA